MIKILYIRSCTKCCYCSLDGDRCLHSEGEDRRVLGTDIPKWCPLPDTPPEAGCDCPVYEDELPNDITDKEYDQWYTEYLKGE